MPVDVKDELIVEVKKRRNLYDNKHLAYHEKDARSKSFHEISEVVNRTYNVIETG